MFRFKCEKCGHKRARLKICGKCGRTNPCPVKKLILQIVGPIVGVFMFAGVIWSSQLVAKYRAERAAEGAASFAAPREASPAKPGRSTGGGRGGRDLNWR